MKEKYVLGLKKKKKEKCIDGPSKLLRYTRNCKIDSVFDVNVGNMSLMHILMSSISTENLRAYSLTPWMLS